MVSKFNFLEFWLLLSRVAPYCSSLPWTVWKSVVLTFRGAYTPHSVDTFNFCNHEVESSMSVTYLGLPICTTQKSTRDELISHFINQTRKAYGVLVPCKLKYNRQIPARLYSFVNPHLLALSPFWPIFTATDVKYIRSIYFKYAKFLLKLPLWIRNTHVSIKYSLTEPVQRVKDRRDRFAAGLYANNMKKLRYLKELKRLRPKVEP